MEYILYVILVFTGDAGAQIDSQPFESKSACESAAATVRSTIREQVNGFPGDVNRFNIQLRCVPAGDTDSEETE